jgi:starch synthase
MAKQTSVLFVTSEVFPFVKVGGIADVSYSLPLALRDLGYDVRVMMPKYGNVSERKNKIHEINRLKDIPIKVGASEVLATVKSSSMNNPRVKVQAYITTNREYLDALKGVYSDAKTGEIFNNNDERFIFFNKSVIETCMLLNWYPDIIHCNDWYTGLIPAYIRTLHPSKFRKTKLIYTIHNFSHQGIFSLKSFSKTGLSEKVQAEFIHKNKFNFLKGGLHYSDYITTVSPSYAQEILNDKKANNGLNVVLQEQSDKFTGILNGIDHWAWNPKTDVQLQNKFTNDYYEFKNANKKQLLKQFDLDYKSDTMVIGIISRLDEQKGLSLVIDSAKTLFKEKIQIVLLGEGNPEIAESFRKIQAENPKKFSMVLGFDETLAHLMEAGCDALLMPSLSEPCGLNALYSILYGTLPIARATGGLKDIITEFDEEKQEGNGFLFANHSPEEMLEAVKKALKLFKNKDIWEQIALVGMNTDLSWKKNVKYYDDIYKLLMKDVK